MSLSADLMELLKETGQQVIPELIDRIQRLTERLTELLSDRNQNAISDILENVDRTTEVLAARGRTAQALQDAANLRGFPFVDVQPRIQRDRENRRVDLTFEINEAPRVFVERIEISGNTRTQDRVIRREFSAFYAEPDGSDVPLEPDPDGLARDGVRGQPGRGAVQVARRARRTRGPRRRSTSTPASRETPPHGSSGCAGRCCPADRRAGGRGRRCRSRRDKTARSLDLAPSNCARRPPSMRDSRCRPRSTLGRSGC